MALEFGEIYVVDLGGDWKKSGVAGGGNVFGIGTGVAISFLVKSAKTGSASIIRYCHTGTASGEEKLSWLSTASFDTCEWTNIAPDAAGYWLNQPTEVSSSFLPLADKATRASRTRTQERAIFRLYSLGISTNRDEWLYDFSSKRLQPKVRRLIESYDNVSSTAEEFPLTIKWSRNLKQRLKRDIREPMSSELFVETLYRPYIRKHLYQSPLFVDEEGLVAQFFPRPETKNCSLLVSTGNRREFAAAATDIRTSLDFFIPSAAYVVPRYRYLGQEKIDNITDWALEQFRGHYAAFATGSPPPLAGGGELRAQRSNSGEGAVAQSPLPQSSPAAQVRIAPSRKGRGEVTREITKDAIFHYVYGVLHDPLYREKYALNLKREFPRIPFYADFWTWADWGKALMALHIGYETVEPWPLERVDAVDKTAKKSGVAPKALLKARKDIGVIELDSETQLTGVPPEAWEYRLGNRSALEWILDQYKEKTPKDPTIREKFNTYRFADYKEHVIDLLKRVTRVSVETMKIIQEMKAARAAR